MPVLGIELADVLAGAFWGFMGWQTDKILKDGQGTLKAAGSAAKDAEGLVGWLVGGAAVYVAYKALKK